MLNQLSVLCGLVLQVPKDGKAMLDFFGGLEGLQAVQPLVERGYSPSAEDDEFRISVINSNPAIQTIYSAWMEENRHAKQRQAVDWSSTDYTSQASDKAVGLINQMLTMRWWY